MRPLPYWRPLFSPVPSGTVFLQSPCQGAGNENVARYLLAFITTLEKVSMSASELTIVVLERMAEMRARLHQTAASVRDKVTCALNGHSCTEVAGEECINRPMVHLLANNEQDGRQECDS